MNNVQNSPTPGGRSLGWILSIVLGLCVLGLSIALFSSRSELVVCRENRDGLTRLVAQKQALADSIKWSGRLANQTAKTDSLSNETNRLRERIVLDSCARLSDLELMRSINQRYRDAKR